MLDANCLLDTVPETARYKEYSSDVGHVSVMFSAIVVTTDLSASSTAPSWGGGGHGNNSKFVVTGDMVLCASSRQINGPTESSSYLISPLVLSLITEVLQVLLERDITTSIYRCTLSHLHPAVWVLSVCRLTLIPTQLPMSLENKVTTLRLQQPFRLSLYLFICSTPRSVATVTLFVG